MNYIIDFKNTVTEQDITDYLVSNSCTQIKTFNHFEKVYLVGSDTLPPTTDVIESIVQDSSNPVLPLDVSQSYFDSAPQQYSTDSDQAWWKVLVQQEVKWNEPVQTLSRQGQNIVVYVVDSGINLLHPEFANTNCTNLFSFNNDFTDNNGHGTAIASVIVGNTCGITNSTVKSVKIFHQGVDTLQSDMLSAFDAIIDDYIAGGQAISIVNLSWSIPKNTYIESKIQQLQNFGIAIICAAGNSGVTVQDVTPASLPGVIVVGSFNQDLEPSNFSNYTSESVISFTANETNSSTTNHLFGWSPGEKIYVAKLDNSYGYSAGTSMAAATATACLAYNLGIEWTEDKRLAFAFSSQSSPFYFNHLLFFRENILTLSSKYAGTHNRCSTINNTNAGYVKHDIFLNEIRQIILFNQYTKFPLYDKLKYDTITYNNLPPGLNISNGIVYGTVTSNTPEQPQKFTSEIIISGPNSSPLTLTLTITAIDSYKNRNNYSGLSASNVDPTLDITLLDDLCCIFGSTCPGTPYSCTSCCNDYCGRVPQIAQCTGNNKSTCNCDCVCGPPTFETTGFCCGT